MKCAVLRVTSAFMMGGGKKLFCSRLWACYLSMKGSPEFLFLTGGSGLDLAEEELLDFLCFE